VDLADAWGDLLLCGLEWGDAAGGVVGAGPVVGVLRLPVAIRMLLYLVSVNLLVKLAWQPTRLRWVLLAMALHLFALVVALAVEVNHQDWEWLARDGLLTLTAMGLMFTGLEALYAYTVRRSPWERNR
jgi:hypothetical protein